MNQWKREWRHSLKFNAPPQFLKAFVSKRAAVKSFVGGEPHDSFVIRARKGQMMTVLITRRVKKDGNFNMTVSKGATFVVGEPVKFGRETDSRTQLRWTGRIPSSGNYYFYTTAYPGAKYVLKVTVK